MRLVIVSNRLPVVIEREEGHWRARGGAGGLVTALEPVLRRCGGLWIGWPGTPQEEGLDLDAMLSEFARDAGYCLKAVEMTGQERDGFYDGFSNQIIWPLFHDLQSICNFEPGYWEIYQHVNRKFSEAVQQNTSAADYVWIHDYHLMGVGRELRRGGASSRLGFFLHIPFPPPDIFCKLPWRNEVLEGLLAYDLVGFQSARDRVNFEQCLKALGQHVKLRRKRGLLLVEHPGGSVRVGTFPISIDYQDFATRAGRAEVVERVAEIRREFPNQRLILGVDRLDYTKGIPYRLRAFRLALQRYSELHRFATLVQIVVPSREAVPQYRELKSQIERLVSEINGQFTQPGWVPIHHHFRRLEPDELLAYYRAADVGLITPLKDGMNLVAKEYCACQTKGEGVLILSEFAGAAAELRRGATLVNPYALDVVADAIREAVTLDREQARARMRRLRRLVSRHDIYSWVESFLRASGVEDASAPSMSSALPPTPALT